MDFLIPLPCGTKLQNDLDLGVPVVDAEAHDGPMLVADCLPKQPSGVIVCTMAKHMNMAVGVVSVSIREGINHNAAAEIVLGTLVVNRAVAVAAEMFSLAAESTVYDAAPQKAGIIISSTVVGLGAITDTFYNGVADAPDTAGAYHVTVNVAEGANYEAISAISVGTFTINKATPLSSHFEYTPKNIQFDNNPHTVIVSLKNPYTGTGTITVKYNGETTSPSAAFRL